MRITITSVANTDSGPVVDFVCQYGGGRGTWRSGIPRLGQEYVVELDFNQPLSVGVNTKVINVAGPHICSSELHATLAARVENVFDEHTASLRIGDSLILVEYEGVLPPIGTYVEVTLPQIELFDTGI